MLGRTYEINIQLSPVLMPLYKFPDITVELCLESIVYFDSIFVQYIYGECWIISSASLEFLSLCEAIQEKNLVLICSAEIDFDFAKASPLPIFYGLFPAIENPTTFLMRKISCNERTRNIDLPPVIYDQTSSEISSFAFENFEIASFSPQMFESGIHMHLSLTIAEKNSKINPSVLLHPDNQEIKKTTNSLDNIINSICKKKGKKGKKN